MNSWLKKHCCPARFAVRLVAIFLGTMLVGLAVAFITHRKPEPVPTIEAQADVHVYIQYDDGRVPRAARLTHVGEEEKSFLVGVNGARKTLIAGRTYELLIQPLDSQGKDDGNPEKRSVTWVQKDGDRLDIVLRRPGRKPSGTPVTQNGSDDNQTTGSLADKMSFLWTRPVTEADLAGKSADEVQMMINWIYAHAGYRFRDDKLRDFFSKNLPGYKPVYPPGTEPKLDRISKDNKRLLEKKREQLRTR